MNWKTAVKAGYLGLRGLGLRLLVLSKPCVTFAPGSINSILVIRIDRIGDCVVSLPVINALKSIFPQAKLSVLVRPALEPLMKLADGVDEVIAYEGFLKTAGRLRERKFSLAVDLLMDYTLKTAWLGYFSKAKASVGFNLEGRGRIFNLAFNPSNEKKAMSRHLLDLAGFIARSFGIPGTAIYQETPKLILTPALKNFAQSFLKEQGALGDDLLLGLAPGGNYPSQRWSLENFAQLADSVRDRYNARIVIIASDQEEEFIVKLVSLVKIKPILAIGLQLDKLASVIASMRILICNNSGPLHMAAALGVATVSTMGPTVPSIWWPQGKNNIVVRRDLACSPCNRAFCRSHECMEGISVEEMEKAVEVLMAQTR